ncbi:hypothetical protein LL972_15250 [Xanthomonas campestris pv. asclepiadis]|nr:patatin-like phospholipase family protein [Xanthomonas campestris]MCC4617339.1 hypothetical protein [Xanthomonas campestris pv. asclepiadis]
MSFNIISCDGGGIRGLITALLIQDLDQHSNILSHAACFAGTSTGGLLALALVQDVPIGKIIEMYMTKGASIFEPNGRLLDQQAQPREQEVDATLASGPGFFSSQYKNDGLIQIASGLLGATRLADAKRLVVVNAARLWDATSGNWMPATFSNGVTMRTGRSAWLMPRWPRLPRQPTFRLIRFPEHTATMGSSPTAACLPTIQP